jgi:SAM-dependent methyltransferase
VTRLEQRRWSPEGRALREVPCNLCGSAERRQLAVERGLPVVRCRGCGLVYVTPRPDEEELERFYRDYYPEESADDWWRIMIRIFRRDAQRLEARIRPPGRLLDVGTGFGHFLELMRERGWDVAGVESSPVAARHLEARGPRVHRGRAPQLELPEGCFDAVTASSVLEHVSDPLGVLAQARRCLRPGGWIAVRVPNLALLSVFFRMQRWERRPAVRAALRRLRKEIMDEENLFTVIDPPAHLFGFDRRTLGAALARAGFRDVTITGDPMPARGDLLNALVDGTAFRGAELLRVLSVGRIQLAPNLMAFGRR